MAQPAPSANATENLLGAHRRKTLHFLERVVRSLPAEKSRPVDEHGDELEQVIVDAEIDGDRYLLVRIPKLHTNPVVLSPREIEIVRMVGQGHPNKVIADLLNISAWTVGTHLRRVFSKLGVCSRAAMIARLLENGSLPEKISSTRLVKSPASTGSSAKPVTDAVPCSRTMSGRTA
jgi:DNA-binding CsgD family transcriptional regulator